MSGNVTMIVCNDDGRTLLAPDGWCHQGERTKKQNGGEEV